MQLSPETAELILRQPEPPERQKPKYTVQQVFLQFGESYIRDHHPTEQHMHVMHCIALCRTSALGGYQYECPECGHTKYSYRPCLNRHCPNCQAMTKEIWIEQRLDRMLPIGHFHLVLTVPEEARPLALYNREDFCNLMFMSASKALRDLGAERLGVQFGITIILHTWTREMLFHPHVHCIITAGGLDPETQQWKEFPDFLLPIEDLRDTFRDNMLDGLTHLSTLIRLNTSGLFDGKSLEEVLDQMRQKTWVANIQEPFTGVEAVVRYLGRYTHCVAISDWRILDVTDTHVTFATRDGKSITITGQEFIRRFLLHILPGRFNKIRHYGLYSTYGVNHLLPVARQQLRLPEPVPRPAENWEQRLERITGHHPLECPNCHKARMTPHLLPVLFDMKNHRLFYKPQLWPRWVTRC